METSWDSHSIKNENENRKLGSLMTFVNIFCGHGHPSSLEFLDFQLRLRTHDCRTAWANRSATGLSTSNFNGFTIWHDTAFEMSTLSLFGGSQWPCGAWITGAFCSMWVLESFLGGDLRNETNIWKHHGISLRPCGLRRQDRGSQSSDMETALFSWLN